MAMATQTSLFTPPLSNPKPNDYVSVPWKQSPTLSFTNPKPLNLTISRNIRTSATKKATKTQTPAKEEAPAGFTPPELDPTTPSPIFGGSTGGLLRKAQVEEFYVITWDSPKEQIFEMPTGGAAIMREGPNLLKLARKEQCLALGTRLRSKYKIKYQFYRVFPNGEVQYLHPKDGVYPEKVNPGRQGVGQNFRSIGSSGNFVGGFDDTSKGFEHCIFPARGCKLDMVSVTRAAARRIGNNDIQCTKILHNVLKDLGHGSGAANTEDKEDSVLKDLKDGTGPVNIENEEDDGTGPVNIEDEDDEEDDGTGPVNIEDEDDEEDDAVNTEEDEDDGTGSVNTEDEEDDGTGSVNTEDEEYVATAAVNTEDEDDDDTDAVNTEDEEDEIADVRKKKIKKTSSRVEKYGTGEDEEDENAVVRNKKIKRVLHRCLPKKLEDLILLLKEGKKDPRKKQDCIEKEKYIKECGFGGLLKLNITIIPGVFVSWLLNNFDKDRGMVVNENARITVGEKDVKRVYDLPMGKKIIDLEKVDKSKTEKLKKFKEELGYVGENYDSMLSIHTNVLYERLMNFEITENKAWAKAFILLAIGTILCPTTSYLVSLNYATVLNKVERVSKYNWCHHLIQHLNGGIKKGASSGKADFHFLLVHFLDMVQTTRKNKIIAKPPSCGNWEDDIVSKELKKIKMKGGFNKVIILDKKDCDVPESSRAEKDLDDEVMQAKNAEIPERSREKVVKRKGTKRKAQTQDMDDDMMEADLAPLDYSLEEAKKQIKICDKKLKLWTNLKCYWVKQAEKAESSMRKGKEVEDKEHHCETIDKEDEPGNESPNLVESEDKDDDAEIAVIFLYQD